MFKVAIIGGGVIGGMIARQIVSHEEKVVILEAGEDVALGQSKANSGIVHAGYDPVPGTLKAKLNIRGAQLMEEVCHQLNVKYRRNGTLVVGFDEEDMKTLRMLKERGEENGVEGLSVITGEEVRKMEKNLSEEIIGALNVPTGAIVCPYELTIFSIGHAMDNGARLLLGYEVSSIKWNDGGDGKGFYDVQAADGRTIQAEIVINCAGIHSDEVARMVGDDSFTISPRRGEYLLYDKETGSLIDRTIFRTPTKMGKGVLAIKTVDGNIMFGPTSEDRGDKEDKSVHRDSLTEIINKEGDYFDSLPLDKVITQFTGIRAHGDKGDFIINSPKPNFINVAGIESPGLSSSPAIAEMVEKMAIDMGVHEKVRPSWTPERKVPKGFAKLSMEEKNQIIKKDPAFGRIVCRCEEVTEGEIVQAIHMNPPARDIDGIKRRTRAGAGRCQGGFCLPQIAEILARELNIPMEEVTKQGKNSHIVTGRVKGGAAK